ncbi:hypothetical protein NFHSH190041_37140 (plasmid) [Shewanella sp. NFH-SH190041]|uniref:hypothetical protein n=1 Tax=Shewanella sp. NFH-SH190041 TaxID=2950245 RepID=UPI0021C368D7|nr:hypothetical protein [Shewanella sp. NFH-SH190041]BDM66262.1 hypothetical protein NFHSH190041_37140 [Shewanella sp. NFH-SH190041]
MSHLLAAIISLASPTSDWYFTSEKDPFTNQHWQQTLGQNARGDIMALLCTETRLTLTFKPINSDGPFRAKAYAFTDNNPGMELSGQTGLNGFYAEQQTPAWGENWDQLIQQLRTSHILHARVFGDKISYTMSFDISAAGRTIGDVLAFCQANQAARTGQ